MTGKGKAQKSGVQHGKKYDAKDGNYWPDLNEKKCADCGAQVDGAMAARTQKAFGVCLCRDCGIKRSQSNEG